MSHDPVTVAKSVLAAWSLNDIKGTLAFFADDCCWIIHVSQEALPMAGKAQGLQEIEERLEQFVACFAYQLFRPMDIAAEGELVRARVEIIIQHRASGQVFSGRLRLLMGVREGKLVSVEEFHDAPLLEAFMRFANSR